MSLQDDVIHLVGMIEGDDQDDDEAFSKEFARCAFNAAKRGEDFETWFAAFKTETAKHGDRHE